MNVAILKDHRLQNGTGLADIAARLPGGPRVRDAREHALRDFERFGLPSRRVEDFKYTDLRALLRTVAPMAPPLSTTALNAARRLIAQRGFGDVRQLVLVDGAVAAELSDFRSEEGLSIRTLRDALATDEDEIVSLFDGGSADAVTALIKAVAGDGIIVDVAANVALPRPLHIVHVATTQQPAATVVRSLLRLGDKSKATLVESFIASDGAAAYQTFDMTTLRIGDHAGLEHLRLIEDAPDAINLSVGDVTLGSNATYNMFGFAGGGQLSRYQSTIVCKGEGGHVSTNGVAMLGGRQHADTTFVLDHAVPNCSSREVFRAVLDDQSRSVFQGRIIVRPHAQKTDAKMMTRALLLSDEAEADNKPELEIFADDVTCGHGATVGALDDSLLFYLRARGLNEKQAQALLIQAFVGEAIESIVNEPLRDGVIAAVERWLEARA